MCFFHSRTHGLHGSHGNVVAERHRPHEVRAANAKLLSASERCGYEGAPGMGSSAGDVIIGLIGMRQLPVGKSGFDRPAENVGGDDGGDSFAAVGSCKLD